MQEIDHQHHFLIQSIWDNYNKNKIAMNAGEIGILEADLASMLRRGKQREEQHRRLFDYNNSVIDRRQEIIDAIFVHD